MLDSSTQQIQLEYFLEEIAKRKYPFDHPPEIKKRGILAYYQNKSMKQCHIKILSCANKSNEFDLSYNWDNFGMNMLIKNIVCWEIKQNFHLNRNQAPSILRQIEDVVFPILQQLQLNTNLIESVEGMCNMYIPNLERLSLSDNKITYVRSLRKLISPNLRNVELEGNLIKDLHFISQIIGNQSNGKGRSYSVVKHDKPIQACGSSKYIAKVKHLQPSYLKDIIFTAKKKK